MATVPARQETEDEDCSLLPLVHDIIKCSMDKDSQEVHQELNKLKTKIQEAREQISAMPGIELSPAEQQQQLQTLREQVRTKNQLLQKYKGLMEAWGGAVLSSWTCPKPTVSNSCPGGAAVLAGLPPVLEGAMAMEPQR
ncbi:hypothetical protein JZ751_013363 [Albula glossodonta]|uniref:Mediator of RNA polymerase II transcription subunit 9 n=1 Tax=Albula glossodonta TaxID=121402 RepID=A0A8T2N185_9TELE|nr:hypothetical protein JZ751_013363 [Albula glossodonta]